MAIQDLLNFLVHSTYKLYSFIVHSMYSLQLFYNCRKMIRNEDNGQYVYVCILHTGSQPLQCT